MSASTQAFVGLQGALLVAVVISAWQRPAVPGGVAGDRPIATGLKVDPNTADAATLTLLPGIGPGIAEHVVKTRESGVVFGRAEDLEAVRFIGPSVVSRVSPWVEFTPADQSTAAADVVAEAGP